MTYKYTIIVCIIALILPAKMIAQNIDSIRAHSIRQMEEIRRQYNNTRDSIITAYDDYRKKAWVEYEAYRNQIKKIWGDNYKDDSKSEWVEYSSDMKSRSVVDFENGIVSVEVTLDSLSDNTDNIVDSKLTNAIKDLLTSTAITIPYESVVDIKKPVLESPVLENVVDLSIYDVKTSDKNSNNVKEIAQTVVSKSPVQVSVIRGDDGHSRKVAKVNMILKDGYVHASAQKYKEFVSEFSSKYKIDPALIYAVIEQESFFNPKAKSEYAYGLMQIVPTTGGLDANKYVNKIAVAPKISDLYDPKINIELGTAYLKLLENQFASIKNPDCRRLCVIASYNTGAGNLSKAFIGSKNISRALPIINTMSYEKLYTHLTTHLNSLEARNYVKGVSSRREKYLKNIVIFN